MRRWLEARRRSEDERCSLRAGRSCRGLWVTALLLAARGQVLALAASDRGLSYHPSPSHYLSINSEQPPNEGGEGNNDGGGGGLTDADFDSNWDEAIESFDKMDLPEELLRGIYSYGFEKPSAIQQRAIKPTMLGRDLIAQAQSGTVR